MNSTEFLRENIRSIIPDLAEAVVLDLIDHIANELGVTNLHELTLLREDDLKPVNKLKPIKGRLLLEAWKAKAAEEWREFWRWKENKSHALNRESAVSLSDSGIGTTRTSMMDRLYVQTKGPSDEEYSEEYAAAFKKYERTLRQSLDPDHGLLHALLAQGLLTHEQYTDIIALKSFYKMNDEIIDIVKGVIKNEEEKIFDFLSALIFNNQRHIVNMLQCRQDDDLGTNNEDMPLQEEDRQYISSITPSLCQGICLPETFLAQLTKDGAITPRHSSSIKCLSTEEERIERLLDILRRRSQKAFQDFANAIEKDLKNPKLAKEIKSRTSSFVAIHQEFITSGRDQQYEEKELCSRCLMYIRNNRVDDIDTDDCAVVNVRHGNSIVILIACRSLQSVDRLKQMDQDGQLKKIFFKFFSKMGSELSIKATRLRVETDQLHQARSFFKEREDEKPFGNSVQHHSSKKSGLTSNTSKIQTPHELDDAIYENKAMFENDNTVPESELYEEVSDCRSNRSNSDLVKVNRIRDLQMQLGEIRLGKKNQSPRSVKFHAITQPEIKLSTNKRTLPMLTSNESNEVTQHSSELKADKSRQEKEGRLNSNEIHVGLVQIKPKPVPNPPEESTKAKNCSAMNAKNSQSDSGIYEYCSADTILAEDDVIYENVRITDNQKKVVPIVSITDNQKKVAPIVGIIDDQKKVGITDNKKSATMDLSSQRPAVPKKPNQRYVTFDKIN